MAQKLKNSAETVLYHAVITQIASDARQTAVKFVY